MKHATLATFILSTFAASLYAGDSVTTSTTAQTEQITTVNDFATAAQAIREGDLETLKTLDNLQSLVDKNTGNTLLHIAAAEAEGQNIEAITEFLFNEGVDGDVENKAGLTPTNICMKESNYRFRAAYLKHKSTATEEKETDTSDDFATAVTFEDSDTESEDLDDKFQAYMGTETRGSYFKDSE